MAVIERKWRFDALNGFFHFADGRGKQIDHGDEGPLVAVATGPRPGRLKDAVESHQAGIGIGGAPAPDDGFELVLDGCQGLGQA